MPDRRPILLWFRRDLRLADHPVVAEAAASGRPVVPVFLNDEGIAALGAAPRMRVGMGAEALARDLEARGSRLVLRSGRAAEALATLARETGAGAVWWTRLHDPVSRARDGEVEAALAAVGVEARAFPGHLLFEPEAVRTGAGGPFKVYAPFFRSIRGRDPGEPLAAPVRLAAPEAWPESESLADWRLDAPMKRGAAVVVAWQRPGEVGAHERLERFLGQTVGGYAVSRDRPALDGSSRLSENLTVGELSPRAAWVAAREAAERGEEGAEKFLGELAWRDFAHHLLWHFPKIAEDHWRGEWSGFPWRREASNPLLQAWQRGRTGIPIVDAGMREMYVTGRMNNRVRMLTASLLVKHMLVDWRLGMAWFADCLTDWDPASNAVNWQWIAGSGPDASPFFRIFNPETQARTHDPEGAYVRQWVAEGQRDPPATALSYFEAVPRSWGLSPSDPYPAPVVDLAQGREAALAALRAHRPGRALAEGA